MSSSEKENYLRESSQALHRKITGTLEEMRAPHKWHVDNMILFPFAQMGQAHLGLLLPEEVEEIKHVKSWTLEDDVDLTTDWVSGKEHVVLSAYGGSRPTLAKRSSMYVAGIAETLYVGDTTGKIEKRADENTRNTAEIGDLAKFGIILNQFPRSRKKS